MVEHYGSQCGYCTPGFVMSMFEGYYRDDVREPWQVSDQLCGNLCRCTGYRPIRDAFVDAQRARASRPADPVPDPPAAPVPALAARDLPGSGRRPFHRPTTLAELVTLRAGAAARRAGVRARRRSASRSTSSAGASRR
jgi:xanthine dehydrogenase iron-sulfur cluster and FAD-binding subunit A